jgi:predicted regulator of Ras-like GTPase activity (Roadblock/LC7/MglB family)
MIIDDNLIIENLNKELERLENFGEIIGTAIVNRNGLLISSRLPREIDGRKLASMAAIMYASIETATSGLIANEIENLTVDYQDYQLTVLSVNDDIILVSLFDLNANLGLLFIEIEESIKNIKKIIEK